MPRRLPLQRTFSLAKDAENPARDSQDFDYARYWQPDSPLSSVSWERLLEQSFCVVLGEAGIGKTTEFQDRADRLQDEGKSAFFVPLNIALDKDSLSDRFAESGRSLSTWQAGSDVGYFFLDAVDEARLTDHADLEKALRNVIRQIGSASGALARARFMLSSRISDWYVQDVRDNIEDVIGRALDRDRQTPVTPLVYSLDPLSTVDAKALAQFYGVSGADLFWGAVERHGYEYMATVPLDLQRMARYWSEKHNLAGLTEMMEGSIETRLGEHNHSHQKNPASVSLEAARESAELLAAACSLSGRPFVAVPDHQGPVPDNTVSASEVLKCLTPEEIKVLLSTAIFDEASYGRVRFHHRTTRDYLAAKWISQRTREGWPIKDALSLFVVDPFDDGPVVVPARQPVLAWFASMEPKVRERVIAVAPDTVFSGGDPEAWSAEDMGQVLRKFAQLPFHVLATRAAPLDVGTLTRIGRRAGEKVVTTLLRAAALDSFPGAYLATHFLHIAKYAALSGCVEAVFNLYVGMDNYPMLKGYALATLAVIGTEQQRQVVRKDLLEGRITNNALRARACSVLVPGYLSAQELAEVLVAAEPEPQANGILSRYVQREVLPLRDFEYIVALLEALLAKLPKSHQGERQSPSWITWLVPELFVVALLSRSEDGPPPAVFFQALSVIRNGFRASPQWQRSLNRGVRAEIDEFLATHPVLRRGLALAEAERHPDAVLNSHLHAGGGVIKLLSAGDDIWAQKLACDQTLPVEKRHAAFVLLVVATRPHLAPMRRAWIREAIGRCDSDERRTRFYGELKQRRLAATHRRREEKRQREWQAECERQKAVSKKYFEGNADSIRRGDHLVALASVIDHYIKPFHSGGIGDASGCTFSEHYGPDLWAVVKEGFRRFWRKTDAPLRAEVPLNQVPYAALVGLVGIALDVEDGYDVRSERSAAARLVRYALWNTAGAPAWFEELASAHPEPVADAIWLDVERDLRAPMAGNARTVGLDLAVQGPVVLRTEIARRLRDWLRQLAPDADTLPDAQYRQVLEIIRDAGAEGDEYLEGRARQLLDACAGIGNWRDVGYWLGFLLTIAPTQAWGQVETLWNSDAGRSETDAVHLACGLGGANGVVMGAFPALNFLPDTPEMAPIIERMCAFLYGHILRENDIHHRGGEAYSPGERDIAQSVRDSLAAQLARIPGCAAHKSLCRLADTVKGLPQEASFLAFLHDHASKEAAHLARLEPKDIPGLGDIYCRALRSETELFQVVLARLDGIKEAVESGPFSDRVLFTRDMEEQKLQIWLAARLEEACGRQGLGVTREPEVDGGKKPDVHVHHAKGTVCLEIKPLYKKRPTPKGLERALENQLVAQYMGRRNSRHGILVLFLLESRTWQLTKNRQADFGELLVFLQECADKLVADRVDIEGLKVVGMDCREHCPPEVVRKGSRPPE